MSEAKPYHREDLRGDLLRAGRAYIAENGHQALTVRTLAVAVGVSPGAPYHHFRDRRALLLALALDGYAELEGAALSMSLQGRSPEDQLIDMGCSYIAFATRRPYLLDLMYESELTVPTIDPVLLDHQLALRAKLIAAVQAALPDCADEEVSVRVLALWSAIYGLASLRRRQATVSFEPEGMDKDEIAKLIVTLAVRSALR